MSSCSLYGEDVHLPDAVCCGEIQSTADLYIVYDDNIRVFYFLFCL